MSALYATSIKSLPLLSKGKVRDVYALGDDKLLMITTDRLSAFDVVMGEPIPEKGIVLNQMANFWFDKLALVIPNHLTGSMGGTNQTINNYNIQAIDTKSFEDRIYGSSGAIWAANQYATKNIATTRSRT